jgi:hypothetical protein
VGYRAAPSLYREGNGFPGQDQLNVEFSYYRILVSGKPQDTDDNLADFHGVDTEGSVLAVGQRLGAPGPENLASPVASPSVGTALIDPAACTGCAPNRTRDASPLGTFGTLTIRRYLINNTGHFITKLRIHVVDITTFPAPSGIADLRVLTSADTNVTLTDGSVVNVKGTILEEPPFQNFGGGWNSTLTLAQGLAPGAAVPVQFVLGVEQGGSFRFFVIFEEK